MKVHKGRPDIGSQRERMEWAAKHERYAEGFPPYVYARKGQLVHLVRRLKEVWWRVGGRGGDSLVLLDKPRLYYEVECGTHLYETNAGPPTTCELPALNAQVCLACLGKGRTFDKGAWTPARREAARNLGCLVSVEG